MLQVFLYLNLFVAGVAAAAAARYGYEHYLNVKAKNPNLIVEESKSHTEELSDAARAHLMQEAQAKFKSILDNSADSLQADLQATTGDIGSRLKDLGNEIVEFEMTRYTETLDRLRAITEESVGLGAAAASKHQGELEAALQQRQKELEEALHKDMTAEKERLVAELDKKLAGAVTAFLVETLGHNVDLGAQSTYLIEQLAAHKDELAKELKDES